MAPEAGMSQDSVILLGEVRAIAGRLAVMLDVDPARIEKAIANAIDADHWAERAEAGWHLRPDCPGPADPIPIPIEVLPTVMLDQIRSVSGATQTPADLGAVLALATVSAAIAGKVRVHIDARDWVEPLNIYAVAILPPGARKSAVFEKFTEPLTTWERDRAREIGPARRAAEDALEATRATHARTVKEGNSEKIEEARRQLDEAEAAIPRLPRVVTSDATPEALVRLLAENGGHISLLAPEGDPLRIADGRYERSGSARLDELKRAHSADSIRVDRIGREPLYIPRPALTLALTFQPSVLGSLQNGAAFRGEGMLARILWVQPNAMLGNRRTGAEVPPLDRQAAGRFDEIVRQLLDVEADLDENGQVFPRTLELDPEARTVLYDLEAEVERGIGPGGDLEGIADWAAKAAGQAVRLAGLLALFNRVATSRPLWTPIDAESMVAGVEIVRALATHALVVLGPVLDEEQERMRHVLRLAADLHSEGSVKDLFERVRGRRDLRSVDELMAVLQELQSRGCLRLRPVHRPGPGRPPSPLVEVHPQIRRIREISLPRRSAVRLGGLADCVNVNHGSESAFERDTHGYLHPDEDITEVA